MGVRYIVDYDDAIFHNYDLSNSKIVRLFLSKKIDVVMRHSYCVIAGNSYLAGRAKKAGAKNVVLIPTVVDIDRYSPARERKSRSVVIGWVGSPSTQKYIVGMAETFKALAEFIDFKLLLVGASPDIENKIPGVNVQVKKWSEDTEVQFIQCMDIGIMPLSDGHWERGKCGYKLIQYMACAVPIVASPVGVNVSIIEYGGCGVTAEKESDWLDALENLCSSPVLRQEYGASGRRAVETRYSLQAQFSKLKMVLQAADSGEKNIKCVD